MTSSFCLGIALKVIADFKNLCEKWYANFFWRKHVHFNFPGELLEVPSQLY